MKYTLLEPGVCYFSNAAGKSRVNWDDSDYQYPAGKPEQKNMKSMILRSVLAIIIKNGVRNVLLQILKRDMIILLYVMQKFY